MLLHHLPTESFGGGLRHLPRGNGSKVAYIKGVDTSVDLDHLTRYLQIRGISIFEVRRLLRRHSGRPTQVVKVKCSEDTVNTLLKISIVINKRICSVERERPITVIRCFHCQRLGHIAAQCHNQKVCEFCAHTHGDHDMCVSGVKCANCGGSHPSSSKTCVEYIRRYEALTKQHSEPIHISTTASSDC